MERHIDATIVQCSEIGEDKDKADVMFKKYDVDTGNTAQMYQSSSPYMIHIKAANGKVNPPLCSGAARMIPGILPPISPILSTGAFRGISLLNKGHVSSGRLSCGNGNRGASASQARFDLQLSEVRRRRFVMFDHSGNKRRMLFHPAMMSELSALIPPSSQVAATYNLELLTKKGCSGKDTHLAKAPFSACIAPSCESSPDYEPNQMPGYVAMDSLSSVSGNCDVPPFAARGNVEAKTKINHLDKSPELSYFSHENTEDLEALLSSDEDEVSSTGHSPSNLTRNNASTASSSNNEGYSMVKSKRGKREYDGHTDDDTCSTATSGSKTLVKEIAFQKVVGVDENPDIVKDCIAFQEAALLKSVTNNLTALNMLFPDKMSSSSSANNQKWAKKLPMHQQPPAEQSRKEKIKSILRLLRGIIPGGESMATAFVLDEAIQYVRTLQSEVQKLQARKLLEIPKHQ